MGPRADPLEAADRNMARAWSAFLAAGPRPMIVDAGDVLLVDSGLPVALLNQAYVRSRPSDLAATVRLVVDHHARLGVPFALYFRDERAPGLADVCADAGLVEHFQPPLMVLEPVPPAPPPPPPGVEIVTLDAGRADAFSGVISACFGLPKPMSDRVFGASRLGLPAFTGFLAVVDGSPVATSGLYLSDGCAGIYDVATLPEHRSRGIAAAVTWVAACAGAAAGASRAVLQASEAGESVYRRMGFATPARYRQFEPS